MIMYLLLIIAATSFALATDYCAEHLCSNSRNIGCNNTGAFSPKCPPDRTLIEMTPFLKHIILTAHNSRRNQIAGGNLTGFQPATRMATMQWDDELATLAELNVKQCSLERDECHNTDAYRYSEQNLARSWLEKSDITDEAIIKYQIDAFWAKYTDATMDDINGSSGRSSKGIGTFLIMAAEMNVAVGCGALKFTHSSMKNFVSLTLTCNYATAMFSDMPMYGSGVAGSKCSTGTNPKYPALCSPAEPYRVNFS